MTAPALRISQSDLLADPEAILTAAERRATVVTKDGRDHLALVPLPEYVRLTGFTLHGTAADPLMASLVAQFHEKELSDFNAALTFDLEPETTAALSRKAAAYGCSMDVVVNAILHLMVQEEHVSAVTGRNVTGEET